MIDKLIPWKKKEGDLKVRDDHSPITRLREDFDSLWDRWMNDFSSGFSDLSGSRMLGSHIDLDDNEKEYVLSAELPGFEPEDFDVKVTGNVLTLRAEHKDEGKEKNGSYKRYGSFYESFTLPQGICEDQTTLD